MKKQPALPNEKYLESLQKLFLKRVEDDHKPGKHVSHDEDGNYYWKWVTTQAIAADLNVTYAAARHVLHKMREQGTVHAHLSKRDGKMVVYFGWAAAEMPGYKEHKTFTNYRTPA